MFILCCSLFYAILQRGCCRNFIYGRQKCSSVAFWVVCGTWGVTPVHRFELGDAPLLRKKVDLAPFVPLASHLQSPWCALRPLERLLHEVFLRRRVIKGEHKMIMLWRKKHHKPLQLKSERRFKGIIPSTRYWVILARE